MHRILSFFLFVNLVYGSNVLVFKDSDFDEKIAEHKLIMVQFYGPSCRKCGALESDYNVAGAILKDSKPPVPLAKVDCNVEKNICKRLGITEYPILKVYKDGVYAYDYTGVLGTREIADFMNAKNRPASRFVEVLEHMEAVTTSPISVVFGYFYNEGSKLHLLFKNVAETLSIDFRFSHTFEEEIAEYVGISEGIYIMYPKNMAGKFEDSILKYNGEINEEELQEWIKGNIMSLAGVRVTTNAKYFFQRPLIVAYYKVDYEKDPKGTNYWRNRLLKVVKQFTDSGKKIHLAISHSIHHNFELKKFGIEDPDPEKVYITVLNDQDQKFVMTEEFSLENFETFIGAFLDGKIEPYVTSEAVPKENSGLVKVVVGSTFEEIVNDPTKDVLIEFYSPNCGHCKNFEPKYEQLARKLSREKDLIIAKMDATANDIPKPYAVKGYPTLYFAAKDHKSSPHLYEGSREVDAMFRFLAAVATKELRQFDRNGNTRKAEL